MARSYLPTEDNALLAFASNFSTLLTANFARYGVAETVATTYASYFTAYQTALAASQAPETRGNATVLAKKQAKTTLINYTRLVGRTIGNDMNVTDTQRQALGLKIRKVNPTPTPAPTVRPGMEIVSSIGRTVTVSVYDANSATKRGKADGAVCAYVYTFVGTTYPSDPTLWLFNGASNKSTYDITFPDSVANGAQVWICAAWVNRRSETGPVSIPLTINIQGGSVGGAASMKIAA